MFEFVAVRVGEVPSVPKQNAAYREVLLGDPCAYCGAPAAVADHIVPRSISREHGWGNTTAACKRCNGAKSTHSMLAFLTGLPIGINGWEKERQRLALYWAQQDGYLAAFIERQAA